MSTSTPPSEREFKQLYERTSARVFGYVRRRCEAADCADVLADVYLVAWRRFDAIPVDPLPWLFAVARRTLADHWRSLGRRQRLALELQGFQQTVSPDSATQVVEKVAMLQALAELSPADREILLLTAWDGLDAEGVARVLRISPTAARARLSRARHRLVAKFDAPPAELPTPRLATEGN